MIKNTAIALYLAGLAAIPFWSHAQTAFPYNTSVVLAKAGSNNAAADYTLYTTTTPSSATAFTAGPTISFDANVNGIGLNAPDRLLYGAAYRDPGTPTVLTDDVSLYRIGADGAYVNLGLLPVTGQGAPIPIAGGVAEFINFSAGTMTSDGSYVYMTIALKQSGVNKLLQSQAFGTPLNLTSNDIRSFIATISNVASLPATPGVPLAAAPTSYYELVTTDPKVAAGMDGFLQDINQNFPNVSWSNGGIQDIDIDPVNGLVYAYLNYQDPSPSGQSVDVVGFPIVFSAPVSGTSTITSVGNIINQVPDQEVAGIGFDPLGNLYALFTSGQYGQLNLTTGAVDNVTVSNIPTAVYMGQNHLRGDFARAIPQTLPVSFARVEAVIINNQIAVNWSTTGESNNDHFDIEVSADGQHFSKIGTTPSKAAYGNSDAAIDYSFTSDWSSGLLGISMLSISLMAFGGRRRRWLGVAAMAGIITIIYSCNKSDAGSFNKEEDLFVRVAQIDKNGQKTYSKIIKAVRK